jgi:ABC-type multidrug transport system fused ATPase/permease subunit
MGVGVAVVVVVVVVVVMVVNLLSECLYNLLHLFKFKIFMDHWRAALRNQCTNFANRTFQSRGAGRQLTRMTND